MRDSAATRRRGASLSHVNAVDDSPYARGRVGEGPVVGAVVARRAPRMARVREALLTRVRGGSRTRWSGQDRGRV